MTTPPSSGPSAPSLAEVINRRSHEQVPAQIRALEPVLASLRARLEDRDYVLEDTGILRFGDFEPPEHYNGNGRNHLVAMLHEMGYQLIGSPQWELTGPQRELYMRLKPTAPAVNLGPRSPRRRRRR